MSRHWPLDGTGGSGRDGSFDEFLASLDNRRPLNRGLGDQRATARSAIDLSVDQPPYQASRMPLLQGLYSRQDGPTSDPPDLKRNPLITTHSNLDVPLWSSAPAQHFTQALPEFRQPTHNDGHNEPSIVSQFQPGFEYFPGRFLAGMVQPSPGAQNAIYKEQPAHRLQALQQTSHYQELAPPLHSANYSHEQRKTINDDPFTDRVISSPAESVSRRRTHSQNTKQQRQQQQHGKPSSSTLLGLAHAPPIASGIPLISPREVLPDKFLSVFPFDLLNAVQSKCFPSVYQSNDNVVVSAPTGSGKTAILELGICKLAADKGNDGYKIVYQAPTKALCNERSRDWEIKFRHMNLKVAELTGDTSASEMKRVGEASIIVTTPEKWDSVTRKWADHRKLLRLVALFLIDEVHILKDIRGATLEAVVSRMKTIGTKVRFIALSATVPNSDDIASWLGRDDDNPHLPARREVFGEEFRPVKLRKHIYGYDHNGNDFVFDGYLDQKLPIALSKHAEQKPVLVFCFTRRSCETTAHKLAELWSSSAACDKKWPAPSKRIPVISSDLQEIVRYGVAFHHAGLDVQDRIAVEQSFLRRDLHVICCTSTLAVGVNLPCHTVVLKGTVGYQNGKPSEYSDLEVMQMLGRAGRPQFDSSATAIVLTRSHNKERYEKMISGQQVLESTLHLNLIEHLNSEIGLQTIYDIQSAKAWLNGTFLSVRLRQNPTYYRLTKDSEDGQTIEDRLEEICTRDIKLLQEAALITPGVTFSSTEYGKAMARYMVQFNTMKELVRIGRGAKMEILAEEFKDLRFKPNEKALYREFNKSPFILYPIKETVSSTAHKISLLVQIHLGGGEIPSANDYNMMRKQIATEKNLAFERLQRLARCVVDCKGYDCDAVGIRTALDLVRAVAAGFWEGRPMQLQQIPNIGPVAMRKLLTGGILTVHQLAEKDYTDIERLLSRNPPYGKKLLEVLDQFPRLTLEARVSGRSKSIGSGSSGTNVDVEAILGYSNTSGLPAWQKKIHFVTLTVESSNGMLDYFWRGSMKKLKNSGMNGLKLSFRVELVGFEDEIFLQLSCEDIVGTTISKTLKHGLPRSAFPDKRLSPETVTNESKDHAFDSLQSFDDGLKDDDLLEAVDQLNHKQPKRPTPVTQEDYGNDEFPDVDDFLEVITPELKAPIIRSNDKAEDDEEPSRDAVQLPNGKWRCNHACSNGGLTKLGKTCTHRCCREGVDKPRKYRPPRQSRKSQVLVDETMDAVERASLLGHNRDAIQGRHSSHSIKKRKTSRTQSVSSRKSTSSISSKRTQQSNPKKGGTDVEEICCIDLSNVDDDLFPPINFDNSKNTPRKTNEMSVKARANVSDAEKRSFDPEEYGSDPFGDTDFADIDTMDNTGSEHHPMTGNQTSQDTSQGIPNSEQMSPSTAKKAIREAVVLLDLTGSFSNDEGDGVDIQQTNNHEDLCFSGDEEPLAGVDNRESCASWLQPDEDSLEISKEGETSPVTTSVVGPDTPIEDEDNRRRASSAGQKTAREPAWVEEFDEDFVKEFRGLVNFV